MSGSELRDLESLLVRAVPDPGAFGRRVMEQLMDRLAADPTGPTITVSAAASEQDQEMRDRDVLLAAALGACECWGRDAGCPMCAGEGGPGWTAPHPQLYHEYVAPAAAAMAAATVRTHPAAEREEGDPHDVDMAGQQ